MLLFVIAVTVITVRKEATEELPVVQVTILLAVIVFTLVPTATVAILALKAVVVLMVSLLAMQYFKQQY